MKKPRIVAIAVLVIAGVFAAPGVRAQEVRDVEVAFTYKPGDSAKDIYRNLQRTARKACQVHGERGLHLKKYELVCQKQIIAGGVARLNRADVAAILNGVSASNDARG